MYSHVVRLVPKGVSVIRSDDMFHTEGCSEMTVSLFEDHLCQSGADILRSRINKSSYLLNGYIEMKIASEQEFISLVEMRICLANYEKGLSDAYDVIQIIAELSPLKDHISYETVCEIGRKTDFVGLHMDLAREKYEIFRRTFPDFKAPELTEKEFCKYVRLGKAAAFFHRSISEIYEKI